MSDILDHLSGIGLTNALTATLLAVAVIVASRWIRRPAIVHTLWLLVFCELLAPPSWLLASTAARRRGTRWRARTLPRS